MSHSSSLIEPRDRQAFIAAHTAVASPPFLPEIRLHLATEVTPLWLATEAWLAERDVPPPFWAFAWAGGQALSRWLLDNPEVVRGRRVLDFAAGSGLVGIAAAMAGARHVMAVDIDPFAASDIAMNAALNGVTVEVRAEDLLGGPVPDADVIVVGDVCYERALAERVLGWLRGLAGQGKVALMGDPGRAYLPEAGLEKVATYSIPTLEDLESVVSMSAGVYRVLP